MAREEPWAKIPHWVITHPDLDAYAIRVYAVIAKHARKGHAHPSIRTIAEQSWCAILTVRRSLEALEKVGAVVIVKTSRGKRHTVNNYFLPASHVLPDDTRVLRGDTSDVLRGDTELEEKIKRTRDELSTEEQEPVIEPGEKPSAALRRIRKS